METLTLCAKIDNYNFEGGNITSNAGLFAYDQFLQKIHFFDWAKKIPLIPEDSGCAYSNADFIQQAAYMKALGYNNSTHLKYMQLDPMFSGRKLASAATVSRYYKNISEETIFEMTESIKNQSIQYVNEHVEFPVLDIDSTYNNTYGNQEESGYNAHYGENGYNPQEVNEANSGLLLTAELRPGTAYASSGCIEMILDLLFRLKHERIFLRCDSAYCRLDFIEAIEAFNEYMETIGESKRVYFCIRVKNFGSVVQKVMDDLYDRGINIYKMDPSEIVSGETTYRFTKSKLDRRVIYEANCTVDKFHQVELFPNVFCVMTNMEGKIPKELLYTPKEIQKGKAEDLEEQEAIKKFYRKRGGSENFNKELKNDCKAGKLSHRRFEENAFDFLISCAVYNSGCLMKKLVLTGENRTALFGTIREKLLKVPGRIVKHARKTILKISETYVHHEAFEGLLKRTEELQFQF